MNMMIAEKYKQVARSYLAHSFAELGCAAVAAQQRSLINLEAFERATGQGHTEIYRWALTALRRFFLTDAFIDANKFDELRGHVIALDGPTHRLGSFAQECQSAICELWRAGVQRNSEGLAATFTFSLNSASIVDDIDDFDEWVRATGGLYAPGRVEEIELGFQANDLAWSGNYSTLLQSDHCPIWHPLISNAGVPRRI